MPHSLRAKLSGLRYKGILEDKDYKRLCHALDLEKAEQEPKTRHWIPVSERMPNFNDIVLASTDSDYDELKVILTVYEGEEFWFNGKIKAWMPLPKPYKAESEDEE